MRTLRERRLWLRYLIADLEGDTDRMRRLGHVLDALHHGRAAA